MPLPWLVPAAFALGQWGLGELSGRRQRASNMDIAKYQTEADHAFMREMNEYNTPANQRKRLEAADYNPHMFYGMGNPGNQSTPVKHANIQPADFQKSMDSLNLLNQTAMTRSQVQAIDARTTMTTVLTDLNRLQKRVLEKNPALDDAGYKAIIDSLISSAQIKASQSQMTKNLAEWQPVMSQQSAVKLQKEIELLDQRFNLNTQDKAIKAEILKSKQFQNAILEVQKKWMADGEMTPQHFFQFISILLMKSL